MYRETGPHPQWLGRPALHEGGKRQCDIESYKKRGKQVVEVTAEAEEAWVKEIIAMAGSGATAFLEECTPGYYNREGRVGKGASMQSSPYAPGINAFNALLERWREQGDLDGMELR